MAGFKLRWRRVSKAALGSGMVVSSLYRERAHGQESTSANPNGHHPNGSAQVELKVLWRLRGPFIVVVTMKKHSRVSSDDRGRVAVCLRFGVLAAGFGAGLMMGPV